ncbi:DUF4153 domain-containing protein [Algoriphagus sp. NG3]|uniref:DUF4153 domain-containing protein n=1 Tax=Algoriphagus sp. NG3 TaxID=3097546 RepID=UPI002A83E38F|nr:DUF4153 domain-containing protein [Algoriphagus sp. NG3]WPR75565.1 DUF4153 domain-containing protein [Algoriphagus sp. NG3]
MKFPSITQLQQDGTHAALRFPFSLLFGFLAAGLGCWMIELNSSHDLRFLNLLLTFGLGIPLFFCIDVFAEKKRFTLFQRSISWIIGLVFLGLIYMSFPSEDVYTNTRIPYIRYTIYNLAIHLMVSFLPYVGSDNQEGFWNYNKNLFIRLVTGIYYSSVIFIGISLALLAINALFEVNIKGETYAQLFVITYGIFNTWFFLADIPHTFANELTQKDYPKGLKIFTQFILIPLLLVYLCILYLYGGKIIFTGDWPKGIVSYMIIAISVLGIFTNLLLYPYHQWKESGWIKKFYRGYYVFLIPLIILLFLAIGIRIQDYGLTVNRYIITLMGIWLGFISIYYSLGKRNIKIIPLSLTLVMLFSSFGPWGMFGLSELMQRNRLAKILTEHNILIQDKIQNEVQWKIGNDGKPKPIKELHTNSLPAEKLYEVSSILEYLEDYHGLENLYSWFEQDMDSLVRKFNKGRFDMTTVAPSKLFIETMGLPYIPPYQRMIRDEGPKTLSLQGSGKFELDISEYEYLSLIDLSEWDSSSEISDNKKYRLNIDPDVQSNLILKWEDQQIEINISHYLQDLLTTYKNGYYNVEEDEMVISKAKMNLKIRIQIQSLTIRQSEEDVIILSLKGILLINENKQE